MVELPVSLAEAVAQKYGDAPGVALSRASSFEADAPRTEERVEEEETDTLRATVVAADRMPPRPVLGVAPRRPRRVLEHDDDDPDLTGLTHRALPEVLTRLVAQWAVPRGLIARDATRDCLRATSLRARTLCYTHDRQVARVAILLSVLDEHIPHERIAGTLRRLVDDPRLFRRWWSTIDCESVTCAP